MRNLSAIVLACCVVAGACTGGTRHDEDFNTISSAPDRAAEAFVGTDSCVMTTISDVVATDGSREIREHFSCTLEASDDRVTGRHDLYTVTVVSKGAGPIPKGLMWWVEQDTLTNAEGSWRNTGGYGVVDMIGIHPLAQGIQPFNYGMIQYAGEGNYAGLGLTIIYTGTNESGGLAGWIEPAAGELSNESP